MLRSPGAISENARLHRHHAGSAIDGSLDEGGADPVGDTGVKIAYHSSPNPN
jgi:hypothetical protein